MPKPRIADALLHFGGGLVVLFLLAPSLLLIPMSFSAGRTLKFPPPGYSLQWYQALFSSPAWSAAALTSLQVALLTAGLATLLGTLTALGLMRGQLPGRNLVQALVLAPSLIPVTLTAIGIFALFLRWRLAGTAVGLVLAHTTLALPAVVINVMASLQMLDRNIEAAAASCGAPPFAVFRYITLPLILPG
ncbi:MAG: ABC transporter permease, partial [Caldilineaceae bacterium]